MCVWEREREKIERLLKSVNIPGYHNVLSALTNYFCIRASDVYNTRPFCIKICNFALFFNMVSCSDSHYLMESHSINVTVLFSFFIMKWLLWNFSLKNCNIFRSLGPFPAGVILHSYLGSAEMVPEFSKLSAYFSFSGFLMSLKASKTKKMLKMVIFITSDIWLMLNVI